MGLHGSYSITGGNKGHLDPKFDMETKNIYIYKAWSKRCEDECDIGQKCSQVRELCGVRDRSGVDGFLSWGSVTFCYY